MEASHCFSKPRSALQYKLVHTSGSVGPKYHLCGSILLLCFTYRMSQCRSSNATIALVSPLANLFCFRTSTTCHYMLDSAKQLPSFYILLDRIGIILHIWGTSISVLCLEANDGEQQFHGPGSHTGWGDLCHLFDNQTKRKERTSAGYQRLWGLALCSVSLYNAVFSSVTRLTASYIFLGLVSGIGG